jgi:RecG-like helicase
LEQKIGAGIDKLEAWVSQDEDRKVDAYEHPQRPRSVVMVAGLISGQRASVEGRVSEVEDVTTRGHTYRQIVIGDSTGEMAVTFRPGHGGADIQPGQVLRITGKARQTGTRAISMLDPAYQVIEDPANDTESEESEETSDT